MIKTVNLIKLVVFVMSWVWIIYVESIFFLLLHADRFIFHWVFIAIIRKMYEISSYF